MDKRTILFLFCTLAASVSVQYFFQTDQESAPIEKKQVELVSQKEPLSKEAPFPSSRDETFYVLENEYQQLVFSNLGGSLAEINLPFQKISPKSLVQEIDFDRKILKQSPQNARFPLHAYQTPDGSRKEGSLGGYYPLLRRGLNGQNLPPDYYGLSITGDSLSIANTPFQLRRFEKDLIEFQGTVGNARITKTYSIPKEKNGPYCFQLELRVDGNPQGLWLCSGIPDVEIVSKDYSPNLRIQLTQNKFSEVESITLPKKSPTQSMSVTPNWISNCNGFLGVIMDPLSTLSAGYKALQIDGNLAPTRLTLIDPGYQLYPAAKYPGYTTYLPLQSGLSTFRIIAGPYDTSLLKELDALYDDPLKGYNPDYVDALSIQGWFSFISQPFSKFLFWLMQIFYSIFHSWAVSIILLTIALRAMMYPLNNWSIQSSIKTQEVAPKVKAIQEKYKKDPKKAQVEVMNLYRQSGVNPLMGCFPVLLQMPFMIGMLYLLKSSFPLRGAVFIPGWIDDLSAPDVLFSWDRPIWLIGNEFHLLPILMGLTMYLQQKFSSKLPKDQSKLTDSQKQQKMMGYMLPIIFTVIFYNFPSGLNLYFALSTLLGIAQQAWVNKKMKSTSTQKA